MSLLDEWDSSGAVYGEPRVSGDLLEETDADLASPRGSAADSICFGVCGAACIQVQGHSPASVTHLKANKAKQTN